MRVKPVAMFEEGRRLLGEIKSNKLEGENKMAINLDTFKIETLIRKVGPVIYEFMEFRVNETLEDIVVLKIAIDNKFDFKVKEESPFNSKPQAPVAKEEPPMPQESKIFDATNQEVFDRFCKYCRGSMWDNTTPNPDYPSKPRYTCKDKACGGTYWTNPDSQKGPNWSKRT